MGSPSWLDLGVRGRIVFAGIYLATQAALVLSSPLRPDRVFSFQMFNESSTITIHLSRRLIGPDGREQTVPTDGRWEVASSESAPAAAVRRGTVCLSCRRGSPAAQSGELVRSWH